MSTNPKYDEILDYALSIYNKVGSWAEFSNAIFAQGFGKIAVSFASFEERSGFLDSEQYDQVCNMLAKLMHKFGLVQGSTPTNNLGLDILNYIKKKQ